jgi:hypothetical protein
VSPCATVFVAISPRVPLACKSEVAPRQSRLTVRQVA